ncbi:MAG: FISUMP domain-containing protein [Sphingobacteriaceae bacterium]
MKIKLKTCLVVCLVFVAALLSCKKDKPKGETVTDVDGNVYHTVKIGTQTWMLENLSVTKLNDGVTPIDNLSNTDSWKNASKAAYCWYNNDQTNKGKYGALYNGFAVKTGKLAPQGWHVATSIDWNTLIDYLIANGYNYDKTTTGNKMAKSVASAFGWDIDNTDGSVGNNQTSNNKSGLTIQPSGIRNFDALFVNQGKSASFWISNVDALSNSYGIHYTSSSLYFGGFGLTHGLSVRCVKD